VIEVVLHYIDNISDWVGRIGNVLVIGIVFSLIYEIIARYIFHSPTMWAHEMSAFIFGAFFMLTGANCLRVKGHVAVDIFTSNLSRRRVAILDSITFIFLLLFCIALVWYGGKLAWDSWIINEHRNSIWAPPLYPARAMIPIAAFILLLQGLAKFIRDITTAITGRANNG